MKLDFFKMHAQGNDYIFFDFLDNELPKLNLNNLSKKISQRRFGVGSDGIVLILPSANASVKMRIFNSDGSEAPLCGTALRCIVFYLHKKYPDNFTFSVETKVGIKSGRIIDNEARIEIGEPKIVKKNHQQIENFLQKYKINVESIHHIDIGNPHLVIYTDNLKKINLARIAPKLEKIVNPIKGINIEFCTVMNSNLIKMIVWERGSGITYACGSGASSSVASGVFQGFLDNNVIVDQTGGQVSIQYKNDYVFISGKTEITFYGTLEVDEEI
ncbi:MAG: diaminopimelate epimerase [Candidatus Cloacimonadota bacterium]|nr:diaminopimelate epimerase [Candidatus Cloacimonadota bacterium]